MNVMVAAILMAASLAGLIWCIRTNRLSKQQKLMTGILLGAAAVLFLSYCILTLILIGGID